MESINVLIDNLLNLGKKYANGLYDENDDIGSVIRSYQKDYVDEERLISLINISKKNKTISMFILDIIFLIDANSITDKVFLHCLNYPGRFRQTLLMQLAHVWLSERQLEQLNQILKTPEAFYKLFLMYLNKEDISVDKLQKFILQNLKHIKSITNYKEHLETKNANETKIQMIDDLIQNYS